MTSFLLLSLGVWNALDAESPHDMRKFLVVHISERLVVVVVVVVVGNI